MDFRKLKQNGYAYTYAVVNFETGEVYTTACDVSRYPLKYLYKRFESIRRESVRRGWKINLVLANCVTGAVIVEIKN